MAGVGHLAQESVDVLLLDELQEGVAPLLVGGIIPHGGQYERQQCCHAEIGCGLEQVLLAEQQKQSRRAAG